MPNPPVIAYDAAYVEDHGAGDTSPEQHLWLAVLAQAGEDLRAPNLEIKQDAVSFFESDDLLLIMDLVGIDHDLAPVLRDRAMAISLLRSLAVPVRPGIRHWTCAPHG